MNRAEGRRTGFTLIELVITIAILGILGSLAAGGYAGYRNAAQDYTAERALGTIQDAYLYARTIAEDDSGAVAQVDSLVSEELRGRYSIEMASGSYTITYESNGKTYSLTDGLITETPEDPDAPGRPDTPPAGTVETVTDDIRGSMAELVETLNGWSQPKKEAYFKEHGYTPGQGSVGPDDYRDYLFTMVYGGSWPTLSADFCARNDLPVGQPLYVQPYVNGVNGTDKADTVVVFAGIRNSSGVSDTDLSANLISIDGVWYYGGEDYLFVRGGYYALVKKVTKNWTPLQ